MRTATVAFGLLLWSVLAAAGDRYLLGVDGLACPFCAYGIEKQLLRIDGVDTVEVDVKSGQVVVTLRDGAAIDESRVREAVQAAGFTLRTFAKAKPGA